MMSESMKWAEKAAKPSAQPGPRFSRVMPVPFWAGGAIRRLPDSRHRSVTQKSRNVCCSHEPMCLDCEPENPPRSQATMRIGRRICLIRG